VELKKLPREDDGTAAWPHLRYFTCKTKEEMTMLVSNHSEAGGAVQEYRRLTMFEHVRMIIDEVNDDRRVRKAREDYVREQGMAEGLAEGREQGMAEGREKGLAEGREEAVRRLQKYGMEPQQIAEALELLPDTVFRCLENQQ
jgi:flagellar biosynthesis/type III secretory pathway protein FliH